MPTRYRQIHPGRRPRGIAVVMVLGLLAITLAISYATLRGQGTTTQLARNNGRALDARAAAQSGLAAALRKISENAWAGVNVGLNANVTNNSWYQVTFTTGDAKLAVTDPQYGEYPFRLMIDSIGTASDPLNPAIQAQYHSRCTVQLMRKKLLDEPANWISTTNFTVYQYGNKNVYAQFPVRINGSACLLGKLYFCTEYPGNVGARDQYLSDLNTKRVLGLGDDRPFPTTITIRGVATVQDSTTMTVLTSKLGMVLVDTSASTATPFTHPGAVLTYKLYPGGKDYTPPVLQNAYTNPLQNVTLGPDPNANPLGIFRSTGPLSIQSNVQITGTIITDGSSAEVQIYGTNVALNPYNLPALYGSNVVYQLPSAMVLDDLRMNSGSDVQIKGTTLVWDEFELKSGVSSSKFALTGNLVTSTLLLRGRTPWVQTPSIWSTDKTNFATQLLNLLDPNRSLYFPDYEEKQKAFVVKPTLTFTPDSSGVKPHWQDWSQPLYQPDPADPGLRWEVVRWEDNL
jgi:hypothetical protein